jgi:hypothetical protein
MKEGTINISDIFFGSEQSKYAGIALFMTIIILCLIILFTSSKIPIGERFVFVLFILLISIPSILMSLFELTCIVTGGNSETRWWCWLLAWFISIIIIIYCIMIIISMFISMSNFEMANDRLDYSIEKNKVSKEDADIYAKHMLNNTKTSMQQKEQNLNNNMEKQIHNEPTNEQIPEQHLLYNSVNSNNEHDMHHSSYQKKPEQHLLHNSVNSNNDKQHIEQIYSSVNKVHEQKPTQLVKNNYEPSYKEPIHNLNIGNTLSFPQNSSDLSGISNFDDDKYLSIEKANISAINYSNKYKNPINIEDAIYDGYDTNDDKLAPYDNFTTRQ